MFTYKGTDGYTRYLMLDKVAAVIHNKTTYHVHLVTGIHYVIGKEDGTRIIAALVSHTEFRS